jgi:hypothetical protein
LLPTVEAPEAEVRMTEYVREWEEVYRALVKEVLRGIEFALQPFANSLDAFLAELFSARLPSDWRERWHSFVAQQAELGFFVEPVSVEELETWIEQWARFCGLLPSDVIAAGSSAAGHKPVGSGKASEKFFDDKLALAQRQLEEIQRVLEALGPRLDAAREGESVDVETDVDRVEELIWCYHDALESARAEWLTEDLAGSAMERLQSLHTPASFGLPFYTDEQQVQRATQQERKINERLRRRNVVMDRVVAGAEVAETAGTVAGWALGGGAFLKAAKTGGRWAVVKLAAKVAAGEAASRILDQAVEAAGVSQQTLAGVKLAAAVIGFILNRRKSGKTDGTVGSDGKKRQPPKGQQADPEQPAGTTDPTTNIPTDQKSSPHPSSSTAPPVTPPKPNQGATPADVGKSKPRTGLVPKSTVELGKWGEVRLKTFLGWRGYKPKHAFKTSTGKRFIDWVLDGVAHEAKAGRNVKPGDIRRQAEKDAELVARNVFTAAHWHFFQGAHPDTLDLLTSLGIRYTVHQ